MSGQQPEVGISDADLAEARRQVAERDALAAILAAAQQQGPLAERELPDGRVLSVDPLTFGRARLHIATPEGHGHWYLDGLDVEFMPHLVLPDQRTLGEAVAGQLTAALEGGPVPALMPGGAR